MKKKVLITGSDGFIGSVLIKRLKSDDNFNIYCISRNEKKRKSGYYIADIQEYDFVKKIADVVPVCDSIIHLAASTDMQDGYANIATNCLGTYNICRLANLWKASKVIYMSSLPIIGQPIKLPITEEHEINPQSIYHVSKYTGEEIVRVGCNKKVRTIILRIPSPIGVGMNMNTFLPDVLKRCIENENVVLYGKGSRKQNYVDVRDVADAIIGALCYSESNIFNIAGKEAVSNLTLAEKCKYITNSASEILFSDMEDKEEGYIWDVSFERAERELAYNPKFTLDESIKWLYESMVK